MMTRHSKQDGITFIGLLVVLGVIGFFAMLALKIAPIYVDHYKVKASLESLKTDKDITSKSRKDILIALSKRWQIDDIDSVSQDNVTVTKDMYQVSVQIVYDVQQPIFGNIEVLVHFDDQIEVSAN